MNESERHNFENIFVCSLTWSPKQTMLNRNRRKCFGTEQTLSLTSYDGLTKQKRKINELNEKRALFSRRRNCKMKKDRRSNRSTEEKKWKEMFKKKTKQKIRKYEEKKNTEWKEKKQNSKEKCHIRANDLPLEEANRFEDNFIIYCIRNFSVRTAV